MAAALKPHTTLERDASAELIEKKSRFIAHASPITSEEGAVEYIKAKKKEYSDAKHNVFAYMLAGGALARYSDDGEPQGTAGLPVLEVIKKGGFCDAVIVVTRYFGGVLLGTGGLVRAYSAAAKLAVDEARIVTYEEYTEFMLSCPYPDYERIKNEFSGFGVIIDSSEFAGMIVLRLAVKSADFDSFSRKISEMTSGRLIPVITGGRLGVV